MPQELLGPLGVVLVTANAGVAKDPGGDGGVGDPADTAQDELEDFLLVDRMVEGLPYPDVVKGRALGVEVDVNRPEAGGAHHLHRRIGLEPGMS